MAGNCVTGQYKFYNTQRLFPAKAPDQGFPTETHLLCSYAEAQISTAAHVALFFWLSINGCPLSSVVASAVVAVQRCILFFLLA